MLKIVDKRNSTKQEFKTLSSDDTFLDERGKLCIVLTENVRDADNDVCNAYSFTDNNVYCFGPYELVTVVDTTVTYK